jgi:glutathione synthase/RimK-type ligase-like ATP-grasp enzyme
MVYASEVTLRDLEAVQGLLATPILLQERIDVRYEARVTVVGRAIFTAFVRTPQDAPIDWRRGLGTYSEFSQGELPNVVAARLLAVMDRLGLVYGAVDLALSSSGDYVFFEINPSGAYGWIEDELDYNISSSLARILLRCPSTSHR